MCVLLSRFRINFGTGSGLANANFFLKSGPFQETSRIEESFYCRNISKKKYLRRNQDRKLTQEKPTRSDFVKNSRLILEDDQGLQISNFFQ
jgi:hypothetical protein